MSNYHVSRSGAIRKCGATKRACPLKAGHYSQAAYDKLVLDGDPRIEQPAQKPVPHATQNKAKSPSLDSSRLPASVKKKTQPQEHKKAHEQSRASSQLPASVKKDTQPKESSWEIYQKRENVHIDENHPANIIHKEPVECWENMGNVECVCGKVRYEQFTNCSCKQNKIAGFRIRKSEEKLLQSKFAVKTRYWYHSTTRADWDEQIKAAGIPVHLGNEMTSHEVAANHHYGGGPREYYVYKVMLNPLAAISNVVCQDMANNWSENMDQFESRADGDMVRYVNSYENPGTVSLIGNPKKFIIVGKTTHRV